MHCPTSTTCMLANSNVIASVLLSMMTVNCKAVITDLVQKREAPANDMLALYRHGHAACL